LETANRSIDAFKYFFLKKIEDTMGDHDGKIVKSISKWRSTLMSRRAE
jgi:hypothetical protein